MAEQTLADISTDELEAARVHYIEEYTKFEKTQGASSIDALKADRIINIIENELYGRYEQEQLAQLEALTVVGQLGNDDETDEFSDEEISCELDEDDQEGYDVETAGYSDEELDEFGPIDGRVWPE